MWGVISGVIQIIYLVLKNKFEKDAELKKRKEELHAEITTAVKSRDASQLHAVIDKLRTQ